MPTYVLGISLITDLQALLATLAPAGGVWYAVNTTEPPVYPFIVFTLVSSPPNVSLAGPSALQPNRVQMDVVAATVADMVTLQTALDSLMAGWGCPSVPLDSFDTFEGAIKAYRRVSDWSIWATN